MKSAMLVVMLPLFCTGCATAGGITVHTRIQGDLSRYKTVYIDVQHDAYKDPHARKHGPETTIVEGELVKASKELGLEPVYTEEKADLKVNCLIRHGWGKPRVTIHFNLKTKYITWVGLRLIDRETSAVIGDVEYNRPRSETEPDDLFALLFKALLTKPEADQATPNQFDLRVDR
jgi:hypothetical protein